MARRSTVLDGPAMSTNTTPSDNPDGRRRQSQYNNFDGKSEVPMAFVQLAGDDKPQSTDTDALAKVETHDGQVRLTITAELENASRLVDRDLLMVRLAGKDLPEEEE